MLERIVPVVADVLVELAVLVLGHLVLAPRPDGLHRVERFALEPDRVRDEVGVALDDLLEHAVLRVIPQPVFLVLRLEVEGHGRPRGRTIGRRDRVAAVSRRLPARGVFRARAPGEHRDAVRDHEARVKPHAELTDQLRGRDRLRLPDGLDELPRTRAGDRPDVLDQFLPGHPDAVVVHGQRARIRIDLEGDLRLARRRQLRAAQRLEPHLVDGIRGVRDQLAQENILVRVQGVDHEVQELADLGLKFVALCLVVHGLIMSRGSPRSVRGRSRRARVVAPSRQHGAEGAWRRLSIC